ncbi:DUF2163 domain-containing protein [Methylobacillus flagellatus]|uniref:DUF2163 domain-containing protein n=1 Tax=Methylobacillus flagellatus TaxID=405 RepID=UPI002853D08C|nr:DUF2163 domain-containing protein [Methylobacillus flagellatus]MDR5170733.1 DUF2163 domain-containing protein [Methylobacillus flagellatus]
MKTIPIAVQALLDSPVQVYRRADLFTIITATGITLRWTGCDVPVKLDALTFNPVPLERGRVRWVMGIEVDTMELTVFPPADLAVEGVPFITAARTGALKDATLLLERAYFTDFSLPAAGAIHQFEGSISVDLVTGVEVKMSVKSFTNLLNREMPARAFTPGCGNTLYDTGCGVNREARAMTGSVQAGSNRRQIKHALSLTDAYLNYGAIEFTSGANQGVQVTIGRTTSDTLNLVVPLRADVAVGDTFKAYPGCDRTLDTCINKFANKARFRGFPWIPKPETAY